MTTAKHIIGTAILAGFGGWAAENVLFTKPGEYRYSSLIPGIPFLPVYALGGALMSVATPAVKKSGVGVIGRFAIYGALLTGIEGAAGYLERWEGRKTWDYQGDPIDLQHAALWGALGLISENIGIGG